MRFFEEGLEAVLQLDAIPGQLILAPGHRAPQTLRDIRHKAERQFVRDQPFHQALRIGEIALPARPTTLRPHELPHIAFGRGREKTIRHFPDKLPIGITTDGRTPACLSVPG